MHPSGARPKIRIQKPKSVVKSLGILPDESLDITPERVPLKKVVTFCDNPILLDRSADQSDGGQRPDCKPSTKLSDSSHRQPPPNPQSSRQKTRKAFVRKICTKNSRKSGIPSVPRESASSEGDAKAKYGKPELNSALQLAEKILNLEIESFDKDKALKATLQSNEAVKRRIDEQATRKVNIPPSEAVFRDLVPLEFDEDAFVTAVAEERETKFKSLVPPARIKDPEPDIGEFYTKDFQPEFVSIPTPNFIFPHITQADVVPQSLSYSLYRHRRSWEGLPD